MVTTTLDSYAFIINHIFIRTLRIKFSWYIKDKQCSSDDQIWNQCLHVSPLTLRVRMLLRRGVFKTTLCDKVCQWLAAGRWFSPGTRVSSTNKADRHDITVTLLKAALNTIAPSPKLINICMIILRFLPSNSQKLSKGSYFAYFSIYISRAGTAYPCRAPEITSTF